MHPFIQLRQAQTLVGCAVGHVSVGTDEDIRAAKRAVGRAMKLLVASGMTQTQAYQAICAHAELLGGLE